MSERTVRDRSYQRRAESEVQRTRAPRARARREPAPELTFRADLFSTPVWQGMSEAQEAHAEAMADRAAERALARAEHGEHGICGVNPSSLSSPGGVPLEPAVRAHMERGFGTSFGDVRIHAGDEAHLLADHMNARAVAIGSDVYFGRGEYRPGSPEGRTLLAHELAHVVQQRASLDAPVPLRARRESEIDADEALREGIEETGGGKLVRLSATEFEIVFDRVNLPEFKAQGHRGTHYTSRISTLRRTADYDREDPDQRSVWVASALGPVQQSLELKIRRAHALTAPNPAVEWRLRDPNSGVNELGSIQEFAERYVIPRWGGGVVRNGQSTAQQLTPRRFDVDHIVELQLASWLPTQQNHWANMIPNMELLWSSANRSSGSVIRTELRERAQAHLIAWNRARNVASRSASERRPVNWSIDDVLQTYHLRFRGTRGAELGNFWNLPDNGFWHHDEITQGTHLDAVKVSSPHVLLVDPTSTSTRILTRALTREDGAEQAPTNQAEADLFAPLELVKTAYFTEGAEVANQPVARLHFEVPASDPNWEVGTAFDLEVPRKQGAQYAGEFTASLEEAVTARLNALEHKKTSPVHFTELAVSLTEGVSGSGVIQANHLGEGQKGLLKAGDNIGPTIQLQHGSLSMAGTVPAEQIEPPGPIRILDSSIAFSGGDAGLSVSGGVDFEVRDLGTGNIQAAIGESGFRAAGSFTMNPRWFEQATLNVRYDKEHGISGGGELRLKTAGIPGLEASSVTVGIDHEGWTVGGSATFRALGLEQTLLVQWSEADGLSVGAEIPIAEGVIPGIRSGSLRAIVRQDTEGTPHLSAEGDAQPAIPGLNGTLRLSWMDGVFSAQGDARFEHENIEGGIRVGVTNQQLDESGQPTGEPGTRLRVFGGGDVGMVFGDYVRGAARVDLDSSGEVTIAGGVQLEDEIELFPQRGVERRLFDIDIRVPVAGITVAGRGVGIFAMIGGGLDAHASFGPGVLRDVGANVEFTPSRPEDTVITGSAEFHVPADAGLRLFIQGGIGASLLVVDVVGGLEVGAELGIGAEANARVDVRWTPSEGLSADAEINAHAAPRFSFDLTGFVEVSAFLIGTVYEERWQAAAFELGSGLQFGIRLPVHFQEGEPFAPSYDDVEVTVPEINPRQLLEQLLDETGD